MDKYFWLELLVPSIFLIGYWSIAQLVLRKYKKLGFGWVLFVTFLGLLAMALIWIVSSRYSMQVQCEAAYGDMAADPQMCDNPGRGFIVMMQIPFVVLSWAVISTAAVIYLRRKQGQQVT